VSLSFKVRRNVVDRGTPLRRLFCSKDTVEERDEQAEFENGPLSVLMQSVKQNSQVCIAAAMNL
jgi:hypothetical protein